MDSKDSQRPCMAVESDTSGLEKSPAWGDALSGEFFPRVAFVPHSLFVPFDTVQTGCHVTNQVGRKTEFMTLRHKRSLYDQPRVLPMGLDLALLGRFFLIFFVPLHEVIYKTKSSWTKTNSWTFVPIPFNSKIRVGKTCSEEMDGKIPVRYVLLYPGMRVVPGNTCTSSGRSTLDPKTLPKREGSNSVSARKYKNQDTASDPKIASGDRINVTASISRTLQPVECKPGLGTPTDSETK
eukprot:1063040-Rhodomonas_salina.1